MAIPQNYPKEDIVNKLLDSLWVNPTSFFNNTDTNWVRSIGIYIM